MEIASASRSADESLAGFQLIGESPAIRAVTAVLSRLAGCNVPVLLRGETGTGKETVL